MQIGSVASTAYNPMSQVPQNTASAATTEAADAAMEALYGLSSAVGGASEAIMNIAAGSLSNAVDIQV